MLTEARGIINKIIKWGQGNFNAYPHKVSPEPRFPILYSHKKRAPRGAL